MRSAYRNTPEEREEAGEGRAKRKNMQSTVRLVQKMLWIVRGVDAHLAYRKGLTKKEDKEPFSVNFTGKGGEFKKRRGNRKNPAL